MESSADVVGVGILLFPVEEEEKAPSPAELPMLSFGFQGMEVAGDFQPPSGPLQVSQLMNRGRILRRTNRTAKNVLLRYLLLLHLPRPRR